MGDRGPIPKRTDQRRRRNLLEGGIDSASGATSVEVPDADGDWHPIAIRWFVSLGESGQSAFYEPSDWQFACFLAELMTRALDNPRGINGQLITAVMSGMTELLTTEGSRRRARAFNSKAGLWTRPRPRKRHSDHPCPAQSG